ncbi:hypothetical protein TUE45_06494 [Streptomyces reticuli]|nr:hypothetical protein TUE45_06494 [Streptomyces reticuli]
MTISSFTPAEVPEYVPYGLFEPVQAYLDNTMAN